jgi:gliding motility-associated-like protein
MKRIILFITVLIFACQELSANHITGGEMYYTYQGLSGSDHRYRVTLKLFRDHFSSGAQLDGSAAIAVFDRVTGATIAVYSVPKTNEIQLQLTSPGPCITNPPVVHYDIGFYEVDIIVPASSNGYLVSYQRCCRINGINNLGGATGVGATYTAEIPANNIVTSGPINNSAKFIGADTVIVCAGYPFTYSFAAADPDATDQLSYTFCRAYTGGTSTAPAPNPPSPPPYGTVPYGSPTFTSSAPMGNTVSINSTTGLITGTAPAAGIYVVTVCVSEIRDGVVIAVQRKDLQIKVGDCNPLKAQLNPMPTTCDGYRVNFSNGVSNPPGTEFVWIFGDPITGINDTSFSATPFHDYSAAGDFTVKLKVSLAGGACADSATFVVKVYPGFRPGFRVEGGCYQNPFRFTDTTTTDFGVVDTWSWNFGDETTLADTSHLQNPQWTFSTAGTKTAQLTVTNSKGCISTFPVTFEVLDRPILNLAFRDTLICRNDVLQLNASGTGVFSWTPLINIINPNTGTPTVNPPVTRWYYVNLNDNGCIANDSVRVRVVNEVTLRAINDTTICQGDAIQLGATSDGLQFSWTPVANLDNPNIINPIAITNTTTAYDVVATIGGCTATDRVIVTTVPYPGANAGAPQTVCYNSPAQLNGSINGIRFEWVPTSYLNNPSILNPISTPPRTTQYVLLSYDTLGCPKPGRDTVLITVQPKVKAFAGNDTTVVVGQPLLFNGTGGVSYQWSPSTGLSSTTIFNPIGVYNSSIDSVRYKLIVRDAAGCPDSAYVTVTVFKTNPTIFVPTAFTPNNDGLNDFIYPIAVGIRRINYFSIYNRWGQLVFTTTVNKRGWDGKINGQLQNSNVYVWMVSAEDYTGKAIFLKGTVALIR